MKGDGKVGVVEVEGFAGKGVFIRRPKLTGGWMSGVIGSGVTVVVSTSAVAGECSTARGSTAGLKSLA